MTVLLSACVAPDGTRGANAAGESVLLGRNAHYAVVQAAPGETYANLAQQYLGDRNKAWKVREQATNARLRTGDVVAIPLRETNPVGVSARGYQKVPILSYHHFGPGKGRLTVSAQQFRAQLGYLRDNNFSVLPLEQVAEFLQGKKALPPRSVVLSIDDGYKSAYEIAFPMLKEFGYPATIFVYSDFVGRGGLTWTQLKEMSESGLISIQAHSKSHSDLTELQSNESRARYASRIRAEVEGPKQQLESRLQTDVYSYAYPFGAANSIVVGQLPKSDYDLGLTVKRGGNAFFANPFLLRRTMIYKDNSLDDFASALDVFEPLRQ